MKLFPSNKFFKCFNEVQSLNATGDDRRGGTAGDEPEGGTDWSTMLPDLLAEIIKRVDASGEQWPHRRNVVACAGVCKRWRDITREIVQPPSLSGKITFPSCLKQPGPRDLPNHCLVKWNKKTSTFYLYLALTTSLTDKGKFLLAARRYRCFTHTEYVISLDADDFSQGSNAYVGKLSSDFLEANFTIYDSQTGSKPSNGRASRRFSSKLITPQVPAGNFEAGNVSYKKFNVLKTKRPRRMICSLKSPASSLSESSYSKSFDGHNIHFKEHPTSSYTILKNKAPMWNEQLECWFLNFHERKDMTVASVKNFQLVATVDQSQPEGKGDEETVLLQFCKVGADTFTMYYRQPLSAFQAFAICLTSFGIKPACQ